MIQNLKGFMSLLLSKKMKGGCWTDVCVYAILVIVILGVITSVFGVTPNKIATIIVTIIKTFINNVTIRL